MSPIRVLPVLLLLSACSSPKSGTWRLTFDGIEDGCGVSDGTVPDAYDTELDLEAGTQTDDDGEVLMCDLSGDQLTCTATEEDIVAEDLDVTLVTELTEVWTFDGSKAADYEGTGALSCEGTDCADFEAGWLENTGSALPCTLEVTGTASFVE